MSEGNKSDGFKSSGSVLQCNGQTGVCFKFREIQSEQISLEMNLKSSRWFANVSELIYRLCEK